MFIFTAKFNKKKAIAIILALAVVLCAIILIAGQIGKSGKAAETASLTATAKNNGQRVKYLTSLGWEVEENAIEEQEVVIPREFTGVYEQYSKLQASQGFDLSKYGGMEATRYTYRVLNHPSGDKGVVADMIVHRGEVIAGNIQSSEHDGFMDGLEFPKGGK